MKAFLKRSTWVWEKEEGLSLLLALLVLSLFVAPLLKEAFPILAAVGPALLFLLFVVGTIVLARSAWLAVGSSLLAGVAFALEIAYELAGPSDMLGLWRTASAAATFAIFTGVTLYRVFSPGSVTSHRLVGAIVAFLLVGLTFAYFFDAIELLRPGSFHVPTGLRKAAYPELLYYSFVTLTTVGYGDVTPVSAAARALSNVESLVGVLYPAVLIGRLLSRPHAGKA
jgi:hypothetical protein